MDIKGGGEFNDLQIIFNTSWMRLMRYNSQDIIRSYRVSQKTWEFSDEFDIVFVISQSLMIIQLLTHYTKSILKSLINQ